MFKHCADNGIDAPSLLDQLIRLLHPGPEFLPPDILQAAVPGSQPELERVLPVQVDDGKLQSKRFKCFGNEGYIAHIQIP